MLHMSQRVIRTEALQHILRDDILIFKGNDFEKQLVHFKRQVRAVWELVLTDTVSVKVTLCELVSVAVAVSS
jgi:hypothetical protein